MFHATLKFLDEVLIYVGCLISDPNMKLSPKPQFFSMYNFDLGVRHNIIECRCIYAEKRHLVKFY